MTAAVSALGQGRAEAARPTVEVRLAADAERLGPPAWTLAREQWLRELPGLHAVRDPFAALNLRFDGSTWTAQRTPVDSEADPPRVVRDSAAAPYLFATIEYGHVRMTGQCDRDGRARWQVDASGDPTAAPMPLAHAVRDIGLRADRGAIVVRLTAWLGQLGISAEGDGMAIAASLLAAACGPLTLALHPTSDSRDRGTLYARSDGGLLLPAWLAWRATRDRRATGLHRLDRYTLQATTRLDLGAHEAIRQLAATTLAGESPQLRDRARDGLITQFYGDADRSVTAMAAMLRSEDPSDWQQVADIRSIPGESAPGKEIRTYARSLLAAPPRQASLSNVTAERADSKSSASFQLRRQGLVGGTILALILAGLLWFRASR